MSKVTVMQCDRCGAQAPADASLASVTMTPPKSRRGRSATGTTYDVCEPCVVSFTAWIETPTPPAAPAE
jgi:hypothetical protein